MDFKNLMAVQCTVKYDQHKLENVLRDIQTKINMLQTSINRCETFNNKIDTSVKKLDDKFHRNDQRFTTLEEVVLITEQKVDTFQKFTIQNLRLTFNEFKTLKLSLNNYLGDDFVKDQQSTQIIPKSSDFNAIFETRLSVFNTQNRKLSQRMSQLHVQLQKNTSHYDEQAQEINIDVIKPKKNTRNIRSSIRQAIHEGIDQKIERKIQQRLDEMKRFFEEKSTSQLNIINQEESNLSTSRHSFQQMNRRTSISNMVSGLLPNFTKNESVQQESATLKMLGKVGPNMVKMNESEGIQDISNSASLGTNKRKAKLVKDSKDTQEITKLRNQFSEFYKSADQNKLQQNSQPPTTVLYQPQEQMRGQSMQNSINALKQQIFQIIRSQVLQFKTCLQSVMASGEKLQADLSIVKKYSRQTKQQLSKQDQRINDLKHETDNMKNSVYEAAQKAKEYFGKTLQQESKTSQLALELKQLRRDLDDRFTNDQSQQKNLRQIQNLKSYPHQTSSLNNSGSRTSTNHKSSFMVPSLKQESVMQQQINLLGDKVLRLEDKMKGSSYGSQSNLPKIDSASHIGVSRGGNTPSIDILRKDVQRTNEELNKTNQRLQTFKKNLKELEAAHNLIPKKLETLQSRINSVSDLKQDRLLELIKQIINRVLTDPFNNHFTNGLKKQIHIKFLQIKHEYSSIWKDIENKVADRAETSQIQKMKEAMQTLNLQLKALINKKAETEDFKKGMKYLETKLKEVKSYLKQEEDKTLQNRTYYMGKRA